MGERNHTDRLTTHEANPADVAEQETPIGEDDESSAQAELEQMRRRSPEAPEADVSEQAAEVVREDEDWR